MKGSSKLNIINEAENPDRPWYREGLRFKCTGCGKCCTGQPGYVWLTEEEIHRIAEYLNMPFHKVMRTYIRQKDRRYALVEHRSANYDCCFLKDKKCTIYPVRPTQCRTFPWWIQNIKTKESWDAAAKYCEGIQEDSPLVSCEEIEKNLQM